MENLMPTDFYRLLPMEAVICSVRTFRKDGVEYCYVASYLYQEESRLKDYQGEKFEDLPSGEQNHVYRIHEKLETLPEVLPGRRLMVLNDKMEVVYDSQNPKDYKAIEAGYISFI